MLSQIVALVLATFSLAHAYTIQVVNKCPSSMGPIYAAASQHKFPSSDPLAANLTYPPLDPLYTGSGPMNTDDTFTIEVPDEWMGGRIWARQGCTGSGATLQCKVGNCNGGQYCTDYNWTDKLSVAEFGYDYNRRNLNQVAADLSLVQGFNVGMELTGTEPARRCDSPACGVPSAYHTPNDNAAMTFGPVIGGSYKVTFCPDGNAPDVAKTRLVRKKRDNAQFSSN